jgi:putative membrane protein
MHFLISLLVALSFQAFANTHTPKSDAEITNAVMTVNTEEMNLARIGKQKAQHEKVKAYADMMFKEHAQSNDKTSSLRNKKEIGLKESKDSMRIKFGTEYQIEQLKKMEGKNFDRAFMQEQVNLHQKVLDKMDSSLIPNAQDQDLKALLQEQRGNIEKHLQEAKDIKALL